MHPFDELKQYIGFDDADAASLGSLGELLSDGDLVAMTDAFYAAILNNEVTRGVLADEAQVERLKLTLQRWVRVLLAGPHDHDYYTHRLAIGRTHVRVGLAPQYVFAAMNLLRSDLITRASDHFEGAAAIAACARAVLKITDIELAIMVGTYHDVQREHEMRGLAEVMFAHLPHTTMLVDEDNRIVAATPSLQRFLGLDTTQRAQGRLIEDVLAPETLSALDLVRLIDRSTSSGNECVVPRVDVPIAGRRRALGLNVVPIVHPVARALVGFEDITAAIEAEALSRRRQHLANLGSLTATIAHEIRNPLAGMSGSLQVLVSSSPPDDPRTGIMGKVLTQVERLSTLVTELLEFARPIEVQTEVFALEAIARDVATSLRDSEMGETVVTGEGVGIVNPHLFRAALHNVAQNAWQSGATRVEVRVEPARVVVDDNGPGIPEDVATKMFSPFYTTRTRGTGLGLPNAQRTIEAMGGTLEHLGRSPLGGACFEFRLAS